MRVRDCRGIGGQLGVSESELDRQSLMAQAEKILNRLFITHLIKSRLNLSKLRGEALSMSDSPWISGFIMKFSSLMMWVRSSRRSTIASTMPWSKKLGR